jgi:hypothetical protein
MLLICRNGPRVGSRSRRPGAEAASGPAWGELMEHANTRAGLRKLVGAALSDCDKPSEDDDAPVKLDLAEPGREPTQYDLAALAGMARKPMYGGTVAPGTVDQRRRRNRAARQSRRINRKTAK